MSSFAATPEPPYYAVIFTARPGADRDGYARTAERMLELVTRQPGFLGVESTHDADGAGITVSYWRDLDAIRAWRDQPEHAQARRDGRERWYSGFRVRVARVERALELG